MSWLTDLLDPRPPQRREFGGWTYAATAATLSLRSTGNRRWLRFDLRLGPVAYPLLVERRDVLDVLVVEAGSRRLVWRPDHLRSARLRAAEPPEPALWREVDRVALDALCCWPDRSAAGVRPADVAVSGG